MEYQRDMSDRVQQPSALFIRPEPRNGWFIWALVGFLIWPAWIAAIYVYRRDDRAYQAALAEYRHGVQPEWYWEGYHRRSDMPAPGDPPQSQWRNVIVVVGVLAIMAILAGLFVAMMSMG